MNEQAPHQTYQTELIERLIAPQPMVIGLEGGPCSGKSTLTREIEMQAVALNRPVIAIPEAATLHITKLNEQGVSIPDLAANDRPGYMNFQRDILRTIKQSIEAAKVAHAGTDAIITVDRTDIGAYVTAEEYKQLQQEVGLPSAPIHSLVDRLVYLPSVAREDPERYAAVSGTNAARYETTAELAAETCALNLSAVQTQPELHIAWGGDFGTKIRHLAATILQPEIEGEIKMGVPEAEARTLVQTAEAEGNVLNVMDIKQSYHQLNDSDFRLRESTGSDGVTHYYFTIKQGEGAFRHEIQRSIGEADYQALLAAPRIGQVLEKRRHVLLDAIDDRGKRRLWFADQYQVPELAEWHFETDIADTAEFDELALLYSGLRRVVTESAKTLIFR